MLRSSSIKWTWVKETWVRGFLPMRGPLSSNFQPSSSPIPWVSRLGIIHLIWCAKHCKPCGSHPFLWIGGASFWGTSPLKNKSLYMDFGIWGYLHTMLALYSPYLWAHIATPQILVMLCGIMIRVAFITCHVATTLKSPISVGHKHSLEPTIILTMRINGVMSCLSPLQISCN